MGYKGHPGVSDRDVGNVPDKNPEIACDSCDEIERYEDIKGDWKYKWTGKYQQELRCPDCQDGTEDGTV